MLLNNSFRPQNKDELKAAIKELEDSNELSKVTMDVLKELTSLIPIELISCLVVDSGNAKQATRGIWVNIKQQSYGLKHDQHYIDADILITPMGEIDERISMNFSCKDAKEASVKVLGSYKNMKEKYGFKNQIPTKA